MLGISDVRRFRRLVAGACLIGAPVVLFVGAVLHPPSRDDAGAHVAVVADNLGRQYASHTLILVGIVLFLAAVLGLVHLVGEREATFGHFGGGLATLGLFGATAVVAVDGIAVWQMAQPGADRGEMTALLDRIKEAGGFRAIAAVGAIAFLAGMLVLAYGLYRARASPSWTAIGIAAGAIAVFLAQVTDSRVGFAIAFGLYAVTLGAVGLRTLGLSDDEWAASPTVEGQAPGPGLPG